MDRRGGRPARRARIVAGALVVLTLATLAIVTAVWRREPESPRTNQFVVAPPQGSAFNPAPNFMAVSPDGRHLAFSAANRGAGMALWLRSLDSLEVRQLAGEGAQPFWSPDSRFIAFYARGEFKKIDISTGDVQTLIVGRGQSGTWNREGVIVMKLDGPFLSRLSAAGGRATPATTLDVSRAETSHAWPHFLPDGRHFVYLARSTKSEYDRTLRVGSLDSTARTVLFQADSQAVYAPPGHLLFIRGTTLLAQPFDAESLRVTGEAVPIAHRVESSAWGIRGAFSVSDAGVLAYRGIGDTRLQWFDRSGRALEPIGPPGHYANPALSPDGRRAAVARLDPETGTPDIWLIDFPPGIPYRFTFAPAADDMPLWAPDGSRIVFRAIRQPPSVGFYQKSASGTRRGERFAGGVGVVASPLGWSRQGRALVYGDQDEETQHDVWELPAGGNQPPVALLRSDFQEVQGQPSPDGRWLAYVSNESGTHNVYVRSLTSDGKWAVSTSGGLEPKWRRDGRELFYLAADRGLMSVSVRGSGSTLEVGRPRRLFETRLSTIPSTASTRNQYDVTPDGRRFLINQPSGEASASITVVVRWPAALKK